MNAALPASNVSPRISRTPANPNTSAAPVAAVNRSFKRHIAKGTTSTGARYVNVCACVTGNRAKAI
jgi:hypothetical protein